MTGMIRPLAVVCLSLGGTKLQVGALTREGAFSSGPEVLWRGVPSYQACLGAPDAKDFCALLAQAITGFIEQRGFGLDDEQIFGLPFPGPQEGTRWYSNNLTAAFRTGVDLEGEMSHALKRLGPEGLSPAVRVVLDAECDAGGEVYHPGGRLFEEEKPTAIVLNIATGIAAGYVAEGQVLVARPTSTAMWTPVTTRGRVNSAATCGTYPIPGSGSITTRMGGGHQMCLVSV
jgi:hypothetical protein